MQVNQVKYIKASNFILKGEKIPKNNHHFLLSYEIS